MIAHFIRRLFKGKKAAAAAYWRQRARRYGERAVFNIGHDEKELEEVTRKQKEEIFPYFRERLTGSEKVVLDFGCGTGRFTANLAELIDGRAIGIDPTLELVALSPSSERATFMTCEIGHVPLASESVDVIWCCLVLGCITDEEILQSTVDELTRVLKQDGLLFLIENTAPRMNKPTFIFRDIEAYRTMFPGIALAHLHDYDDLGERISVFAGRKKG
jgi:SAM-dependent methyltransferase